MATGMITETERRKICKAHAGDGTLPKIAKIAWGDGGVDYDGQPKAVTGKEVGLYNELLKKDVESHYYPNEEETTCRYAGTIEIGELTGKNISEMGLFDEEGDLAAYKTFLPKGKDADVPMEFNMDEVF